MKPGFLCIPGKHLHHERNLSVGHLQCARQGQTSVRNEHKEQEAVHLGQPETSSGFRDCLKEKLGLHLMINILQGQSNR